MFKERELQRANQKQFRTEKVTKRKGIKLYVKWKGYKNWCDSWIDEKNSINESIFFKNKVFSSNCKS